MNADYVNTVKMLAIVLPIMALGVFGFLNSPMYKWEKERALESSRSYYQSILTEDYYKTYVPYDRDAIIDLYGFTDEDINPEKIVLGAGK